MLQESRNAIRPLAVIHELLNVLQKSAASASNLHALTNDPFSFLTHKKVINYKYANFSHGRLYVCVSIHLLHSALLIPVVRKRTLNPFRRGLFVRLQHWLQPPGTEKSFFYNPPPPRPSLALSVARIQRCKSMHHFSPALRFDIDKSGCYGTASPLVRWLELHWCPTALFSSSERGAAGMDLQDKCSCVCVRESSGTKRPFQSADGMEKVSIMRTSNQSKTKARMQKIQSFMVLKLQLIFCHTGKTAKQT